PLGEIQALVLLCIIYIYIYTYIYIGLYLYKELVGLNPAPHQVAHHDADAEGDALQVGVEEAQSGHALAGGAQELDGGPFSALEVEALFDGLPGEGDHFLDGQAHLIGPPGPVDPQLLREEAVHPVGDDHHVRVEVAVLPVGVDA